MMVRYVLVLVLASVLLSSCSWLGRHGDKCREPTVPGGLQNRPPLQAAAGMDLPDTRNAIKVPELTEPEKPRTRSDPCLSLPPSYGSQ
jgi:uncharacterized lipoprotein